MIDALINTLNHGAQVLIALIGAARLKALLLGLVLSGGSTQFFKGVPTVAGCKRRAFWTRCWAVATAFAGTWLLYPAPPVERMLTALAAGFASPLLYTVTVWSLDKWRPGTRRNLSGDPQHTQEVRNASPRD